MRAAVDSPAILAQVDRILASPHFARSQTLCRFLRFVVGVTLDGKEQELKEYRLGVDVFERGNDFDPRVDPIVRMQAAKLRSRLAEYYGNEGRGDRLVVSIAKGGYVPSFTQAEETAAWPPVPGSPDIQSIAVLPFVNMSPDPENEYFSDGLTEELINLLTSVPRLMVVARTSSFRFKNTATDIREIGTQLNVQTVLEGSVRRAGNQLRVTAQLIEVSTGYHLLSRTYPRELKDVFAVQEELANAVVTEIMPKVREKPEQPVLRVHAADLTAYNHYLRGMVALAKDFHGPQESVNLFEEALKTDPGYAPALAGLGLAYSFLGWYAIRPSLEAMPLGKAAAEKALRADPNLALGHAVLAGLQSVFDWNWAEAERSFQRAVALQPSLALAYYLHASRCLLEQWRVAEAVAAIDRAIQLNPLDVALRSAAAHIYNIAGDYQGALQHYSLGVEINPKSPLMYRAIGLAHQAHGHLDKAIAAFQTACDVSARSTVAVAALGHALASSGDRAAAERLLEEVSGGTGDRRWPLSILHLGLGNIDESLRWLEEAIEKREPYVILTAVDPRYARVRSHSRFQKLLGRMGLRGSP